MQKGPSSVFQAWRDGQYRPWMIARRVCVLGLAFARRAGQAALTSWNQAFHKLSDQKSYPSQRPCPACGERMRYAALLTTPLTGHYIRTCPQCGNCDSKKVKMIRQL